MQRDEPHQQPVVGLAGPEDLYKRYACESCHRFDSTARAPQLAGLFGREVRLKDGQTVMADENYILESILPTFQGQMSQEEAHSLVRYIRGLEAGK